MRRVPLERKLLVPGERVSMEEGKTIEILDFTIGVDTSY